ncbi:MAG: RimK family alpha-L-glutamate ligase [Gemmatimonadota bacterium]
MLPIAIYYEHSEWFRPLFTALDRRGTPYVPIDARSHRFDPAEGDADYSVLLNRMSPSAYLRGSGHAIFYTLAYLEHLERRGVRVINGLEAFRVEISKARQVALLDSLGLPYPRTRVINSPYEAPVAASGLRFPVVVKPNIGGSGARIARFEDVESLREAAGDGGLDLGPDRTGLVQEFLPARGGYITRVELLDGEFLYAIRVYPPEEGFNLCPADICHPVPDAGPEAVAGAGSVTVVESGPGAVAETDRAKGEASSVPPGFAARVEACRPPEAVISAVKRIAAAANIEVGGVEFLVDDRDGGVSYYDINALSNFVTDARRVVGFDPFERLVDFLEREARKVCLRIPAAAPCL